MAVPAPFANRIIVDTDRDDLDTTRFEYRDYVFAALGIVCNSVRHNHENAPLVRDVIKENSERRHSFDSRGDWKSAESGKTVSVRVDLGGRSKIKKKNKK